MCAFFLVFVIVPTASWAQGNCTINGNGANKNCNFSTSVGMQVNNVVQLTLGSTSVSLFSTVQGGDYDGTHKDGGTLSVTAAANTSAAVTVTPTTANFTGPNASKPSTDLSVSQNGGAFATIPAAGLTLQTLTMGSGGSAGVSSTLGFRMALNWAADAPGTYGIALQFTVTAP